MYRAVLGVMCGLRFERSDRNEDSVDVMLAPGTMLSFSMLAIRPRCVVDTISSPRAALSSCEAAPC
jgi:hypothetical protein